MTFFPNLEAGMTLDECRLIYQMISDRVDEIRRHYDAGYYDGSAVQELREFCQKHRPQFTGRFNNVGAKVTAFDEATKKSLRSRAIQPLNRARGWMDSAICVHEYFPSKNRLPDC
jgi:hypothetical protein